MRENQERNKKARAFSTGRDSRRLFSFLLESTVYKGLHRVTV